MINAPKSFTSAPNTFQKSPSDNSRANNVISNNIKNNMDVHNLNFLHADKFSKKRNNDELPNVGIIDTPPQNEAPIANELNKKYDVEEPKEKRKHKKPHNTRNIAGAGVLSVAIVGLFFTLNMGIEFLKKHHLR